jgi:hypothetical protein
MLTTCRTCDRDISPNAISCPHCGEPEPHQFRADLRAYAEESTDVFLPLAFLGGLIFFPGLIFGVAAAIPWILGFRSPVPEAFGTIAAVLFAGWWLWHNLSNPALWKMLGVYLMFGAVIGVVILIVVLNYSTS